MIEQTQDRTTNDQTDTRSKDIISTRHIIDFFLIELIEYRMDKRSKGKNIENKISKLSLSLCTTLH